MLAYSFYESDTRLLQYAQALVERGDSVDIVALRREGSPKFEVLDGANVYRVQSRARNEKGPVSYLLRILRFMAIAAAVLIRKHISRPYDVIHVHSVPDFLVFAALIPKLLGARVVLDIHDILPEFCASKFNIRAGSLTFLALTLIEKISAAFSDRVIVANELWRDRLVSRSVPARKCLAIRNYPDPRMFFPRTRTRSDGRFLITYPGTLNAHQGLDIAIRAFSRVANQMPDAEFRIYGEGPMKRALTELSASLGLTSRVSIHDFLPTREIATVMADSDLAVVPKRANSKFGTEAASTKIMEFMSVGVPVVVSRTKIDSFYHDDSMVKFFESENESELGEALLLLWSNSDLRKQLVRNAFRYIEQNNWDQRKIQYLTLIDSLAPAARPRINRRRFSDRPKQSHEITRSQDH